MDRAHGVLSHVQSCKALLGLLGLYPRAAGRRRGGVFPVPAGLPGVRWARTSAACRDCGETTRRHPDARLADAARRQGDGRGTVSVQNTRVAYCPVGFSTTV